MSTKALERHLSPLAAFLNADGVTEICLNQQQVVYVEKNGQFIAHRIDELTYDFLNSLVGLIAEYNQKEFPQPLLSGTLPQGQRVQFVLNPACEERVIFSIRRHQMRNMTLDNYHFGPTGINSLMSQDDELCELLKAGDIKIFLQLAISSKKNILISGGTGTGKTTFLNACLKCIPVEERIITVEDTREVNVIQPNAAHLLFNEDIAQLTALNIFKTCLRLRPDRIFLSELRGNEVWPYLRAANSGHPGSLSTIHADSAEGAFTQLVFMMQQAGSTSTDDRIRDYIKSIINIVIQLKRVPNSEQFMTISEIYFNGKTY